MLFKNFQWGVHRAPEEGGEQAQQAGVETPGQPSVGRKRGRSSGTSSASRRHIATEQRRRDKINEGYASEA